MTNYTILSNDIITSDISDGAYRLYTMFLSMAYGEKDYVYPSQRYLSSILHRSVRTIQRYIQELKNIGLIRIKRRGSISSIYYLKKELSIKTEKLASKVKETIKKVKKNYPTKKSAFNSFPQRKYNFKELEKQLLSGIYDPNKLE